MKIILLSLILIIQALLPIYSQDLNRDSIWQTVPSITINIRKPIFPDFLVNILDHGAIGDGITDCSIAFSKAIDECSVNGGGKVVVPEGIFLTGPIYLKSNVNLYISENAVVKFSDDKRNTYLWSLRDGKALNA